MATAWDYADIVALDGAAKVEEIQVSEKFMCPRGIGSPVHVYGGESEWTIKPNGDRCCSYCGSLHPDDFWRLVAEAEENSGIDIFPSDNTYKIYVRRPDVKNATEGGIKFYTMHLDKDATEEQTALYKQTVAQSDARARQSAAQRGWHGEIGN